MSELIPVEKITGKIIIRGHKVILDRDLAELYDVETGLLKRVVRRNLDRLPPDFMFEMPKKALKDWRCQLGISSSLNHRTNIKK